MPPILSGHTTVYAYSQVVELLFAVGVQHMCQQVGIHGKIGGLFLLYSIYFTQPCWPKVLVSACTTVKVSINCVVSVHEYS